MHPRSFRLPILLTVSLLGAAVAPLFLQAQTKLPAPPPASTTPSQAPQPPAPSAQSLAQNHTGQSISLDDAIQMALQHNHTLLALGTTIQQNQASEITANLRPNPVLMGDTQFDPIDHPGQLNSDYLDNTAQFDL